MNHIIIVGNLTRDPELRSTPAGKSVCNFSVAVNRRRKVDGQPEADFFRVSAWESMGENCAKYLSKGKKVAVTGSVSLHTYTNTQGKTGSNMEIFAESVEFLSPKEDKDSAESGGYTPVTEEEIGDGLPF